MMSSLTVAPDPARADTRRPTRAAILTHPGWLALLRDVEGVDAPEAPAPARALRF